MRRVYEAWRDGAARGGGFRTDWHAVQLALALAPAAAVYGIARWGDADSRGIKARRDAARDARRAAEEGARAAEAEARAAELDALAARVDHLERELSAHREVESRWRWWRRTAAS